MLRYTFIIQILSIFLDVLNCEMRVKSVDKVYFWLQIILLDIITHCGSILLCFNSLFTDYWREIQPCTLTRTLHIQHVKRVSTTLNNVWIFWSIRIRMPWKVSLLEFVIFWLCLMVCSIHLVADGQAKMVTLHLGWMVLITTLGHGMEQEQSYSSPSFLATIILFRWPASIIPPSILNSPKASSISLAENFSPQVIRECLNL